jgi:hypothetical protein
MEKLLEVVDRFLAVSKTVAPAVYCEGESFDARYLQIAFSWKERRAAVPMEHCEMVAEEVKCAAEVKRRRKLAGWRWRRRRRCGGWKHRRP